MANLASLVSLVSRGDEFMSWGTLIKDQTQTCHVMVSNPSLSPLNICIALTRLREDYKRKKKGSLQDLQSETNLAMICFLEVSMMS